jgi:hypothetical protein
LLFCKVKVANESNKIIIKILFELRQKKVNNIWKRNKIPTIVDGLR